MQLLLVWEVYGHCYLHQPYWPAFARVCVGLLNYTGWRPMSLTADRLDAHDARWAGQAVLAMKDCRLHWQDGWLVAVQVFGRRSKFHRNPVWERNYWGQLEKGVVVDGKLTFCQQVDVCACLAWMVWAIVNGAFGYAPWSSRGGYAEAGQSDRLLRPSDMTAADVDRLVDSLWRIQPSGVAEAQGDMPVLYDRFLGGGFQVNTDRVSKAIRVMGIRLGLNPHKMGAVCGRKTCITKVVLHPQSKDVDCTRAFGHQNPRLTSLAVYTDASARNADSRNMLTGYRMRQLPGSVQLAHTRNLHPDMEAAHAAGQQARQQVPSYAPSYMRLNAYVKAHTAEMQRQFDAQVRKPKAGDTTASLLSFDFQALDTTGMTQCEFVAWNVKQILGLLE